MHEGAAQGRGARWPSSTRPGRWPRALRGLPRARADRRAAARRRRRDRRRRRRRRVRAGEPSPRRRRRPCEQSLDAALGEVPQHRRRDARPPATDLEAAKAPLKAPLPKGGPAPAARLALVVVHPDAVRAARRAGERSAPTTCSSAPSSTTASSTRSRDGLREAIVAARVQRVRASTGARSRR